MIMQMIAKVKIIFLSFEHHKDSCVNLNYQDMWEITKYKKSILFEGYY
jgi:hypothetical protein